MPRPPFRILQPHERQVFLAAHCGDVVGLRKLCAQYSNADVINITDEAGYTPLSIAILQGHLTTVQALVTELGANVHPLPLGGYEDATQQTPAQMACIEGHLDVLAFLVQRAGVDPYHSHHDCHSTTSGTTTNNDNKDEVDNYKEDEDNDNPRTLQRSLLHIAALHKHLDIVQWLVRDYGMAVDTLDKAGQTALHLAIFWHCTAIVDWLLQHGGANPLVQDQDGQTALHLAVARQVEATRRPPRNFTIPPQLLPLIDTADKRGRTPLHQACESRNAMAVLALLQAGANPLVRDVQGRSPLYHVATGGNVQLLQDVVQGIVLPAEESQQQQQEQPEENTNHRITFENLLMELQLPDSSGWGPLHHAIQCGETATVELLLNLGVQVTPLPANNQTVLHLVGSGFVVNWEEYIKSSATTTTTTTTASSATTWREQYRLATHWLLDYGEWFVQYEPVKNGWPPLKIPPVPRSTNIQDLWDIRPNHNDDGRMSQVLLQHANLSVLSKDSDGNLPFFLAAAAGHVSEVFVQLRAAAHEGLFQPQWQQHQQDVSGNLATSETSTTTPLSPKRTSTGAIITPPRQRSRLVYSFSTRSA